MVTKFKTKSAITSLVYETGENYLVYEISPRSLRLTGALGVRLSNDVVKF